MIGMRKKRILFPFFIVINSLFGIIILFRKIYIKVISEMLVIKCLYLLRCDESPEKISSIIVNI